MNEEPQNHLTLWKDTAAHADAPPQPVPEEFPLTLDCGTLRWSKLPIAELSPQTWFAYEKKELGCTVFDGNGRKLFYTADEEIAAFAVKAMNVYVLAAMQTQTEV